MGFDMNYKIKVANEVKSKEVQELFFELGYGWRGVTPENSIFIPKKLKEYFIINYEKTKDMQLSGVFDNSETLKTHKEITLPELRDLVVLKRNDLKDANVSEDSCLYDLYLTESKELYFYHCGKKKWILSNLNGDDNYYKLLKTIEKKEMKEYLRKNSNGKYIAEVTSEQEASEPHAADWIEIPEGAECLTICQGFMAFWKKGAVFFLNGENGWDRSYETGVIGYLYLHKSKGCVIVWQRESPNDKLASAEQYRQAEVLPFIDDDFAESDAWIESNIEQGSIEQTLAQRQSQYGCFEDVAFVTQGMIELMRKCNYDKMPASHQEALHMICSKMARIVNGDFNHKDSWHDIGGYAKLIEDEIFDDITEMPF